MMFAAATIDEPRDKEDYQLWTGTDEHLICLKVVGNEKGGGSGSRLLLE